MRTADRNAAAVTTSARARLVVPPGLLVDEAARERLEQQLRRAAADIAGVVAPVTAPAPGASYRVHAEWSALEPLDVAAPGAAVCGAVLLRPGVEFAVVDGVVDVGGAPLVVDPGATTHDPTSAPGPLAVASERGRPPFPRRP